MDFKKKYLKYKTKYLLSGGVEAIDSTDKTIEIISALPGEYFGSITITNEDKDNSI